MPVKNEIDLLTAVQDGDLKTVKKLARAKDIDKAALQDELDNPILYLAIKQIKEKYTPEQKETAVAIAKELIKNNYPVNIANRFGHTSLHKAVKKGEVEIIDLLIRKGANINAPDENNETPSDLVTQQLNSPIPAVRQRATEIAAILPQFAQTPAATTLPTAPISPAPATPPAKPVTAPPTATITAPVTAVISAVEKNQQYYQDKLLKMRYQEILTHIQAQFYQNAIKTIREVFGAERLFRVKGGHKVDTYKPSVFISYAQEDVSREWIQHNLYKHLTEHLKCHVYFDEENMHAGVAFEDFEKAIFNVTYVIVIATPLYKAKCDAFKTHGRALARSGVSDEIEMIEKRLQDPLLKGGVIPLILPGRVPTVKVDSTTQKVSITVDANAPIDGGFHYLPSSLTPKFSMNCCDGDARKNTAYYLRSFHAMKTWYQIPEVRYGELKRYKKLFLKMQEIIFGLSMDQLAAYKAMIDSTKTELESQAAAAVTQGLSIPQAADVKNPHIFEQLASSENERQQEALLSAIQAGNSFMVTVSRIKKQIDIQWKDGLGDTLVHYSAALGDEVAMDQLLQAGVSVNVQNADGNTPTFEAAVNGQLATLKGLLAHGADVTIVNQNQETVLDRVVSAATLQGLTPSTQAAVADVMQQVAVAIVTAQAHQQHTTPEALIAEQANTAPDVPRQQQLQRVAQQLQNTHSLVLTGQHPTDGALCFGLYRGSNDPDSALRCVLSDNPQLCNAEAFSRTPIIKLLKQTLLDKTNPAKAEAIKTLLILAIHAHYYSYHTSTWKPEVALSTPLSAVFSTPDPSALKKPMPDFAPHLDAYLSYLAHSAVWILRGPFLDAVATCCNQSVQYWQEKDGTLESIYSSPALPWLTTPPTTLHVLQQGLYFDRLTPQAEAGIVVTPVTETVHEQLANEWSVEVSYSRWQTANPQEPLATSLSRIRRYLSQEKDALTRPWPTIQPAEARDAALPTPLLFAPQKTDTPLEIVARRAQEVAAGLNGESIQAYLTAVYRGELDTVETLLKANPSLVHAQGDLTDLSKRTFTNITGFQYAVWALDGPMWDVILKYLPHADAKAQMEAYTSRQDLIQQHGLQYSFDNLLKQYDIFIENYDPWSYEQLSEHWVKKIAPEQAKMPSWMIYAFTEPGDNVAWVELDMERGYLRVLSNEFKDFQRIIESGKGFLRWVREAAYALTMVNGKTVRIGVGHHDLVMMSKFKTKSNTQHQTLVNTLSQATYVANTSTPHRPGQ